MGNRVILGIDNSLDYLNIIVSIEEIVIEERRLKGRRHPSEIIGVEVSDILLRNQLSVKDINLIITTLGPGSFTGIRVSLAFCKGLAAGGDILLIGVPTLDVLSSPLSFMEGYYLCPVVDAKKGEVFNALYYVLDGAIKRLTDYRAIRPEELLYSVKTPCIFFGSGLKMCRDVISVIEGQILIVEGLLGVRGEAIIKEGLRRTSSGKAEALKPIYGRRSEAEIRLDIEVV